MNDAPTKLNENDAETALKARRAAETEAWLKERGAIDKAPSLPPNSTNVALAEHARLVYRINVPPSVPLDRVMEPDYLKHIAERLKPGFIVEALAQDGKWFAELLVRKVGKEEVHCWCIRSVDLEASQEAAPAADEYAVKFGGAHKWRVIRLSDNEVMHHGEPTEADARQWLAEFLKG